MQKFSEWSKGENHYLDTVRLMQKEHDNESRDPEASARRRRSRPSEGFTFDSVPVDSQHDLRVAWRDYVSELVVPQLARHWMAFGTLTFTDWDGQAPGLRKARTAMYGFADAIDDLCLSYVFVEERGALNDRLHYHGLVRVDRVVHPTQGLLLSSYKGLWRAGFSGWEPARKISGAVSYATKYIIKGQYAGETGFWAKRQGLAQSISMEF